jgi:hypothetical protein
MANELPTAISHQQLAIFIYKATPRTIEKTEHHLEAVRCGAYAPISGKHVKNKCLPNGLGQRASKGNIASLTLHIHPQSNSMFTRT